MSRASAARWSSGVSAVESPTATLEIAAEHAAVVHGLGPILEPPAGVELAIADESHFHTERLAVVAQLASDLPAVLLHRPQRLESRRVTEGW